MKSYSIVGFYCTLTLLLGYFGSKVGYTVDGVPMAAEVVEPGGFQIWDLARWLWDSIGFIFHLVTFNIDGLPPVFGLAFILSSLLVILVIIKLVRSGND